MDKFQFVMSVRVQIEHVQQQLLTDFSLLKANYFNDCKILPVPAWLNMFEKIQSDKVEKS
jgi:hypothetical protein